MVASPLRASPLRASSWLPYRRPPGYVVYEEGGALTEAVLPAPVPVVLFDEIEKAHPYVLTCCFAGVLRRRLTDGQGPHGRFKTR